MSYNDIKNRPARVVEHIDGRRGIAYNDDQIKEFDDKDKSIVRFFRDNDITASLDIEKRAVDNDKLITQGYIE